MKEKLYTIPVNEAFEKDSECPLCDMMHELEANAVTYTMGPSYMEDDVRAETDRTGFCGKHIRLLYRNQNRLGLSLMLKTHMEYIIKDIEKQTPHAVKSASLFRKKNVPSDLESYTNQLKDSCFICNKINSTFQRYIITILELYKKDPAFRSKLSAGKGFCTTHFGTLHGKAPSVLTGEQLTEFQDIITNRYITNLKRVIDDLDWFIDKFDYRNADAPWNTSKDALIRSILKVNSVIENDSSE